MRVARDSSVPFSLTALALAAEAVAAARATDSLEFIHALDTGTGAGMSLEALALLAELLLPLLAVALEDVLCTVEGV